MHDVIIIGGGAAGLSAALLLGRVRRDVLLIDEGPGRNAPAAAVHGMLGHDGIAPAQLRELASDQLAPYSTVQQRADRVTDVKPNSDQFTVALGGGAVELGRRILLATGVIDDLPDIDGLEAMWGQTVVHCPYCHGYELRDRPLAVVVRQPADLVRALRLTDLSSDVAVCLNGGPEPEPRALLAGFKVYPQSIARLEAEPDDAAQLRRIHLADGTALDRAGLFLHPPARQATTLPSDLGCWLLDDGSIEVNDLGQTSASGVYAAGDIARRPTMPVAGHQVAIAAGEAVIAAGAIDQDLLCADHGIPFPPSGGNRPTPGGSDRSSRRAA